MRDIAMVVLVIGTLAFGYFITAGIHVFLLEKRSSMEKETEKREPSCMMFTDDVPDEELLREIQAFRSRHKHMRLMLYDASEKEAKNEEKGCFEEKV